MSAKELNIGDYIRTQNRTFKITKINDDYIGTNGLQGGIRMKCKICGKEILGDSQCINYKYYHNDCIENLEKQNNQLKCNWNKLKEYIKETKLKEFEKSYGKRYGKTFTQAEIIVCNMIKEKMQELEQGSDNNE